MIRRCNGWIAILTIVLLGACTQDSREQRVSALAQAAKIAPADERLASLYKQSCKSCHAVENSGAPLAGDRSQWDTRWEKGVPVLMQSTIAGLNGIRPAPAR